MLIAMGVSYKNMHVNFDIHLNQIRNFGRGLLSALGGVCDKHSAYHS